MPSNSCERIEAFFAACGDDGEFARSPVDCPYSVIFPRAVDRLGCVIYATKSAVVLQQIPDAGLTDNHALVARCGLPSQRDGEFLASLAGGRRVSFLGDLDPPDLLIFAWLQEALAPTPINHVGVNDALWRALDSTMPENLALPLVDAELDAVAVLEDVLPNWVEIVGPSSATLLRSGRKLELESAAAVSRDALTRLLAGL